LGWDAAFGVASYNLYLDTDRGAVLAAGNSSSEFQGNFTTTTFTPARPLDEDTTYYWRVDTRNVLGTMRGEEWSFTTREPTFAPFFYGLRSAVAVGPAAVRLGWEAATDDVDAPEAIVYRVYASDTAGGQDFSRPTVTTSPGATSAIITAADFAGLTPGGAAYFVVRAVDTFGQEDNNTVELSVTLMAAGEVVYVDVAAADDGTGSFAAPYNSIQAGIDAVETAGGGTVLVATGTYAEAVTLGVVGSGAIVVIGGFPTFSSLNDDDEVAILGHYAPRDHLVTLNGDGLTLTADQGLITIANGGRPTRLAGLTFTESPGYGIQALDANLEVVDCHFTDGDGASGYSPVAGLSFDTSSIAESYRLTVVGSEFESTTGGIKVGGALAALRVEGNNFHDLSGPAVSAASALVSSVPLPSSSGIIVPTGGTQRIVFSSNRAEQTGSVLDLGFQAEAPSMSGSLEVEISNNDVLSSSGAFVNLSDVQFFGDGGSAQVRIINNSCLGVRNAMVALDFSTSGLGVNDVPDGDVDIEIRENHFSQADWLNIEISNINTAPGGTTTISVEDNGFSNVDGECLRLNDEAKGEAGNNAGGTLNVNIRNNQCSATRFPVRIDLGPPPEGVLNTVLQDNDFGSNRYELVDADFTSINGTAASGPASAEANIWIVGNSGVTYYEGMNLSIRPLGGPTRTVIAGNTVQSNRNYGILLRLLNNVDLEGELDLVVYNNLLNDSWDVAFYLTNELDIDDRLNLYFANNSVLGGLEERGLEFDSHPGMLALIANNEVGLNGVDHEEGIYIDRARSFSFMSSIGSWMIRNNIVANAAGYGIEAYGWAQIVNNTVVRNGQNDSRDGGVYSSTSGTFSQVFVSNSIVWGNSGFDLDQDRLIRGSYSFVGDEAEAAGFMNLFGAPLFTRDDNVFNFTDYFGLAPSSPAIDAGDPRAFFSDPDGSRNDMGAFGGPGAGPLGWRGRTARLPLDVIGVRPLNQLYDGGRLHDPAVPLTIVLTKTPAEESVTASNVVVTDSSGSAVAGSLAVEGPRIVWTPDQHLTPAQWYSLNASGLTDQEDSALRSPFRLSFATAPASGTPETEPNDDILTASDSISSGDVFTFAGTSEIAGAVDGYIVTAEAGDRLRATVFAQRGALSTGDYLLRLTASDGTTVINENEFGFGLDPFIDHLFASVGTYYLFVIGGQVDSAYELVGSVEGR
jgi:hypothetical protein